MKLVFMKEKYDVIIVGAGPAGGTAAWLLAKKGLSVLLMEKKKAVGIPVTCAELLRKKTEQIIPLPNHVIDHQISRQVMYRDYVKISENISPAYMVNRDKLDRYLASQAVLEGADLSIGTRFKEFRRNNGKIEIFSNKNEKILKNSCEILIGADGSGSSVAKLAGFVDSSQKGDYAVTYQYYLTNVFTEEDTADFFIELPYIDVGYAWIFPKHSGTANVGLGMSSLQKANPRVILDFFLHENPIARGKCQHAFPLCQSASHIHTGGPLQKTVDDRILVVGEAAGHVHPLLGEGNYFAIAGGEIASRVCIESFDEEDFSGKFLKRYEMKCEETFARELSLAFEKRRILLTRCRKNSP
jgi:digeranylgeranylglycerophospholipid reductase